MESNSFRLQIDNILFECIEITDGIIIRDVDKNKFMGTSKLKLPLLDNKESQDLFKKDFFQWFNDNL